MADLTTLADEELLRRTTRGDEFAFTVLYRRRHAGIHRFAFQMCGRPDLADEVTQETFLALLRSPGAYDSAQGTLVAYLYGIARRQVLRLLSKDRCFQPFADGEGETLAAATDTLASLSRQESIESVREAISSLPSVYREVVVLCELEELSYQDAAVALGCPIGTVRSRLSRGRDLLALKLGASAPILSAKGVAS